MSTKTSVATERPALRHGHGRCLIEYALLAALISLVAVAVLHHGRSGSE
jgi:hypothetical protein